MNPSDAHFLSLALTCAKAGLGFVEPNPLVGAVVLDAQGALVGTGFHERFGSAHAEVNALQQAGERARGGTLYVTLEPCCHHGKTPPCTGAILAAGIRRVVAAMYDPFPQVAGGGAAQLMAAGVSVEVGLGQDQARALNAPYLKRLATGMPWVHLKWAMSLDGRIATHTGDSQWITSAASRAVGHTLRGRMDAILIGRGTLTRDDPLLTARPPGARVAARVIVTASGDLPTNCQLRRTARDAPVIVYTASAMVPRLAGWAAAGAEIVGLPTQEAGLDPLAILKDFGRRAFTNVLLEGGPGLLGRFFDAGAADEVHAFVAPCLIGGATAPGPLGGVGIASLANALKLHRVEWQALEGDLYLHGFVLPAPGPP